MIEPDIVAAVDWAVIPQRHSAPAAVQEQAEVAWITSPPSPGSGGHQNMWRFIHALEAAGHRNVIYLHDWRGSEPKPNDVRKVVANSRSFAHISADIESYSGSVRETTSVIMATSWETAYPAWLDRHTARRMYFVQDYEPWFYPKSTNALLAENTYRFGFHGLTAGPWLAHRLGQEFGMPADHYDFAVDPSVYFPLPDAKRAGVLFYARPATPRRGYEMGIAALRTFSERCPDVPIHLVGGTTRTQSLGFPAVSHGSLPITELNQLYNSCAAALVISLSNTSLLPLELMGSGVVPIVNDAIHNRMVLDNPHVVFAQPSPGALALAIESSVRAATPENAVEVSRSVSSRTWQDSAAQFTDAFERARRG